MKATFTYNHYKQTMFTTLNRIKAKQTGTQTFINAFGRVDDLPVCEVKARLEMDKDQAAWAMAMALNPYVSGWKFKNLEVSATFVLDDAKNGLDKLSDDLISIYNDCVANVMFKDLGIEPHVLIESLKTSDVYDGERNGPLSNR